MKWRIIKNKNTVLRATDIGSATSNKDMQTFEAWLPKCLPKEVDDHNPNPGGWCTCQSLHRIGTTPQDNDLLTFARYS